MTLGICYLFVICGLIFRKSANTYFFSLQIQHRMLQFKFVHKKSLKKTTFRIVLRQRSAVFCKNLRICGLIINLRICDLQTATPNKFADLQQRNKPKNLRICDLQTLKKFDCSPLAINKKIINNIVREFSVFQYKLRFYGLPILSWNQSLHTNQYFMMAMFMNFLLCTVGVESFFSLQQDQIFVLLKS